MLNSIDFIQKPGNTGIQKILGCINTSIVLILFQSCFLSTNETEIPTGLKRESLNDGSVSLIITARASKNARDKKSPAMMRSTSCKAAKDMLHYELANGFYEDIKNNYINTNIELLNKGEYCRIYGIFNPGGHSKEAKQKGMPLKSL